MLQSMVHWHGTQLCAIDTETTGLDAHWHEIIQICILPLTADITPRRDVNPFFIEMKIECPERIDPNAIKCNKIDLANVQLRGFDKEKAKDLLGEWIQKLELPLYKSGNICKLRPLGQNYAFDRDFIIRWLGIETYNEIFDYHFADTMATAIYLNDRAAMHGEHAPYKSVSLTSLATYLHVEYETRHNALSDCLCTAEVYRRFLKQGLLA